MATTTPVIANSTSAPDNICLDNLLHCRGGTYQAGRIVTGQSDIWCDTVHSTAVVAAPVVVIAGAGGVGGGSGGMVIVS